MSSPYPYPPWSAPASLKKDKSSWWQNTKQALKKPWTKKRKSRDRSKSADAAAAQSQPVYNPYNPFSPQFQGRSHQQQQQQPPADPYPKFFQPRFAPGNMFQHSPQFGHWPEHGRGGFAQYGGGRTPQTDSDSATAPGGVFEPPEIKPNRPLLKDIFAVYDSPHLEKPAKKSNIIRRHSTGGLHAPFVSPRRPGRSSEQSVQSDGARRHRRNLLEGVREIPVLPHREDDQYKQMLSSPMQQKGHRKKHLLERERSSGSSSSQSSEERHRYPRRQDRTQHGAYNQAYGLQPSRYNRDPPFPRNGQPHSYASKKPSGFSSFPPNAPPQNKSLLQELEVEIEQGGGSDGSYEPEVGATTLQAIVEEEPRDDIKGFDGFMMY